MAVELRLGSDVDGLFLTEYPSLDTGTLPALVYDSATGDVKYRPVATSYTLPAAESSVRGGVTIGAGINLVGDKISVTPYSLPTASTGAKGGIVVGTGLSMSGDTLNCTISQVSPQDGILDWETNSYVPYTSYMNSGIHFYTGTTNPIGTNRLNLNGHLYDTEHYSTYYGFSSSSVGFGAIGNEAVATNYSIYAANNILAGSISPISNQTKISAYSNTAIDTLISAQNSNSLFGGLRLGVDSSGYSVMKSGSAYWNWHYGSSDYIKAQWVFGSTTTTFNTYTAQPGNGNSLTLQASDYSGNVAGRRGGNMLIKAGEGYDVGADVTISAGPTSASSSGDAGSIFLIPGIRGYNPRVFIACNSTTNYGQGVFSDGEYNKPSISFRNSNSTGLYSPSVGVISVSLGGVEKFRFSNSTNGDFYAKGDVIACFGVSFPSDINLKTNIESLSIKNSLNKILQLNPVEYEYKDNLGIKKFGLIAQEVELIIPEIVSSKTLFDNKEHLVLSYLELIPLLINSIQALNEEIDYLKNK